MIPYGRQNLDDDDISAVVNVLRSDFLTTGPTVDAFETAVANTIGAGVVAVSSGTAALHSAYAAIGLRPGDEIVTTPLTFAATITPALMMGATVRLADVDPETLTLDPERAAEACGPRTRAIVAVDYAGHPADLDVLGELARKHDAVLLEDASHALGSRYRGRAVGSIADVTTFSFHPVKTITTAEGGAVTSTDAGLLERCRRFRSHGTVTEATGLVGASEGPWYQVVATLGLNYRMPDVLAALGLSQMGKLASFVRRRSELVERYRSQLEAFGAVRLPTQRPDTEVAWHLFTIRVPRHLRREVFDFLRGHGIGVQVHYVPLHFHPAFADLGYPSGSFPEVEAAYGELISLPLHPGMTDADQDKVIELLAKALRV